LLVFGLSLHVDADEVESAQLKVDHLLEFISFLLHFALANEGVGEVSSVFVFLSTLFVASLSAKFFHVFVVLIQEEKVIHFIAGEDNITTIFVT